jgi:phenylacetate-coenzyme A ligase PaaK-like adenylate-forming protein
MQDELLGSMSESIERLHWSAEIVAAQQRQELRRPLAHARRHSPFHRARLSSVDVDRFELADLRALPVMTKTEMMKNLDDLYTDRRLSPALVEAVLAATADTPVPILDEYLALCSGGSSGRRGVFVFDCAALACFFASLTRSLAAGLVAAGGPPPGGLRIAFVCAPSAVHATGTASAFTAGPGLPFHFIGVPATLPVPEIVARLNALQAPALAGYPTMLARLATERRAGRLHISPQHVSVSSEMLHADLRKAIRDGFDAPVVDIFASTEGLVGVSAPDDDVLVFNSDMCIVEPVDERNRPVPIGTPSAKVLVTNLSNLVQPLIRYELGDRFTREPDSPTHGHLRARVEGRADDVLRFHGIDVHPVVVRSVLVQSPEILDYQVRQTRRGIDVDALASDAIDTDRVRTRLADALGRAGVVNAVVTVRAVATLDRHRQTGKLRWFVPFADPA